MNQSNNIVFSMNDVVLNRLKLRPLMIFDQVMQHHSIAHAARALNLTQPAVTKAIKELEDQLNTILFIRTNRGVTPTACGFLLGHRVNAVLAELRHLTDELNTFKGGETGHVVVGTLISASARLLPQAIILMKKSAPNVLITVRVGTVDQLFPALAMGALDLVVGRIPDQDLPIIRNFPLIHEIFYQEKLCLVVGKNHPLTLKKTLTYKDLAGHAWILPPPESPTRLIASHFFRTINLPEPSNVIESLSLMTNINLMMDGDWIGLMSTVAVSRFVTAGLLTVLPFGEVGEYVDVGVSYRDNKNLSPACLQFIKCLKNSSE